MLQDEYRRRVTCDALSVMYCVFYSLSQVTGAVSVSAASGTAAALDAFSSDTGFDGTLLRGTISSVSAAAADSKVLTLNEDTTTLFEVAQACQSFCVEANLIFMSRLSVFVYWRCL